MNLQLSLKDRVDYLLQEWVNQGSHFDSVAGVKQVLQAVQDECSSLQLFSEWKDSGDARAAPSLLVSLIPVAEQNPGQTQLYLTAKAYTTFDQNSPLQLITWAGGRNRAIGPGVLSAKSGILVGLLALEKAKRIPEAQFNINLLIFGHPNAEQAFWSNKPNARLILPLDASPADRTLHYNKTGGSAAKIAAALILQHEKKSPADVALLPGIHGDQDTPFLMGLGPTGTGPHTPQETLEVPSIFTRADIIHDLILNLIS